MEGNNEDLSLLEAPSPGDAIKIFINVSRETK